MDRRWKLRRWWSRLRKRYFPEVLYALAVDVDAPAREAARGAVTLRDADASAIDALRERFPDELTERKHGILRDRLEAEHEETYLIVDGDGQVCGYCHLAFGDHFDARHRHWVRLRDEQTYLFDAYVLKGQRGRGLHPASIAARLELAERRGVREALTIISTRNPRSLASFRRFTPRVDRMLVYFPWPHRTLPLPRVPPLVSRRQ